MKDDDFANLGNLLGNVRQMQEDFKKAVSGLEADGAAGGGMVRVHITGDYKVQRVEISEEAMADREMLQDLVAAATTDAIQKLTSLREKKVQSSMGGLTIPLR